MNIRERVKLWLDAKIRTTPTDGEQIAPDLLKRKPSPKMLLGLSIMALSYVTCWPVITMLGIAAIKFRNHLLFSVGSPAAYIFSHCLFIAGAALVGVEGMKYARAFLLWSARYVRKKLDPE